MKTECFKQGMALLSEAFPNRELNPKLFAEALKDLNDEQFQFAVLEIVQKTTKLYPDDNLIAMIREKVMGSTEDKALIAWTQARGAILSHGYYESVAFEDRVINGVIEGMGGWEKFSSMLLEEEPFRQKEFIQLYEAISRSGRACPERLVGNFERINGEIKNTVLIQIAESKRKMLGAA